MTEKYTLDKLYLAKREVEEMTYGITKVVSKKSLWYWVNYLSKNDWLLYMFYDLITKEINIKKEGLNE